MARISPPIFSARARRSLTMPRDRKSTRLNSSHLVISYAVFCLKKKKQNSEYSRSTELLFNAQQRTVRGQLSETHFVRTSTLQQKLDRLQTHNKSLVPTALTLLV